MGTIKFLLDKIKVVPIEQVRPNAWNPKELNTKEFKKVKRSIELKGLRLPVIVRENNGYEIIDGEQRYRSCLELGYKEILIYNEGEMSDQEAKELTIAYQQQVPFVEYELAFLVNELAKNPEVQLPYPQEEIEDLKKLAEFKIEDYRKTIVEAEQIASSFTLTITLSGEQKEIVLKALGETNQAEVLTSICKDFLERRSHENTTEPGG